MTYPDFAALVRWGNVLQIPPSQLEELEAHARRVKQIGEVTWSANSALDAAAWLLLISHYNAHLDKTTVPHEWQWGPRNVPLLFRGQPEKYTKLVPSLWRLPKEDRHLQWHVQGWFHIVAARWTKNTFGWTKRPEFWLGLDWRDSEAIAQHYGLGTRLIDWSWDPLVAFAFATAGVPVSDDPGPNATVLLRTISKESQDQIILPPTGAKRVWKQVGLFQSHSAPPEDLINPTLAALGIQAIVLDRAQVQSYPRIVYNVEAAASEWARSIARELLSEQPPFGEFVQWSLDAARTLGPPPDSMRDFPDLAKLDRYLAGHGVAGPAALRPNTTVIKEDLRSVRRYAEKVALRVRDGRIGVDKGTAALFCTGVGGGCSLCWSSRGSTPRKFRHWADVYLADQEFPDRVHARVHLTHPELMHTDGIPRPWTEDEWRVVDLFVPLRHKSVRSGSPPKLFATADDE